MVTYLWGCLINANLYRKVKCINLDIIPHFTPYYPQNVAQCLAHSRCDKYVFRECMNQPSGSQNYTDGFPGSPSYRWLRLWDLALLINLFASSTSFFMYMFCWFCLSGNADQYRWHYQKQEKKKQKITIVDEDVEKLKLLSIAGRM